jgi:formate-dependent phosphoribosylglycinamide formyltransferase (GAR transformylase)
VTTVLFVGAGRHQRRAIEQARARGLRVAAVDRNAEAPGLASADLAEVVDFTAVPDVVEVARRVDADGVLTVYRSSPPLPRSWASPASARRRLTS